jgi:RNA-directed DNA polymerase
LGARPSRKKVDRLCREIGELTTRKKAGQDVGMQVGTINRKLKGWSNYFRLGTVSKAYRKVDSHVRHRVRQWLCAKFKVRGQGTTRFPDRHLYQKLGLYQLQ